MKSFKIKPSPPRATIKSASSDYNFHIILLILLFVFKFFSKGKETKQIHFNRLSHSYVC